MNLYGGVSFSAAICFFLYLSQNVFSYILNFVLLVFTPFCFDDTKIEWRVLLEN